MRLEDLKGEQALDALADIIEPASEIITDSEVKDLFDKREFLKLVKVILKKHRAEIIEILATLDGVSVEEETEAIDFFTLPKKVMELINSPSLATLFQFAGQMTVPTSSGSATANTEGKSK